MKYSFILLLMLFIGGCQPKVLSGTELENKLIETMDDYLHETLQPGVTFTIKDVVYFTEKDKKDYICHFNVNMHYKDKDSTGLVAAIISNDFKKVERKQ